MSSIKTTGGASTTHVGDTSAVNPVGNAGLESRESGGASLGVFAQGGLVATLHGQLEAVGITVPRQETSAQTYGAGTRIAVETFQKKAGLPVTGIVDQATGASIARAATGASTPTADVSGYLYAEDGRIVVGVAIRAVHRGVGTAMAILGEAKSDESGFYAIRYTPLGSATNLEIRVVDAEGRETALSQVVYGAERHVVLNLVVPDTVVPPLAEYGRLLAAVTPHLGKVALASLREDEHVADLTSLAATTRWDARLIALAAIASKSAGETGVPSEALYGLFRQGLPWDAAALCCVAADDVETALVAAVEARIVGLNPPQIAQAKSRFAAWVVGARRAVRLSGAVSTCGELLDVAHKYCTLGDSGLATFLAACFTYDGTGDFWDGAGVAAGANREVLATGLALFTLTSGNGPLIDKIADLMQTNISSGGGTLEELFETVLTGFYEMESWRDLLTEIANALKVPIRVLLPQYYLDLDLADDNARLEAYASDIAANVGRGYPNHMVTAILQRSDVSLETDAAVKAGVASFLSHLASIVKIRTVPLQASDVSPYVQPNLVTPVLAALKKLQRVMWFLRRAWRLDGFNIRTMPLGGFLRTNPPGGAPVHHVEDYFIDDSPSAGEIEAVRKILFRLQRVAQISESPQAIIALSNANLGSAADVCAVPLKTFVARHRDAFSSEDAARSVYRKARLIHATSLHLLTAVRQMASRPDVHALSGDRAACVQAVSDASPTIQDLLGELDYCECEHDKSVLSPAAYFVDIMRFLDPSAEDWADWKATHGLPGAAETPFVKLDGRRPDLKYLPLTVANTNTAMPYIDIMNEIMEFYLACREGQPDGNPTGDDLKAHIGDTGSAVTEDLVAEPRNLIASAYETLKSEVYPLTLPFNLWTETIRRFLGYVGLPFSDLLELFRKNDALDTASPDDPYGPRRVFIEGLGFAPEDEDLFANPPALHALYGVDTDGEATGLADSAADLANRLGISYVQFAEVVQTRFVNSGEKLGNNTSRFTLAEAGLFLLRRLGLDLGQIVDYKTGALDDLEIAGFEARCDAVTAQYADVAPTFDARTWLDDAWDDETLMSVLHIDYPTEDCNFASARVGRVAPSLIPVNPPQVVWTPATDLDLLKINLFVRLWKKLGWSIEETDQALMTFLPRAGAYWPLRADTIGNSLKNALIQLAHLKALSERLAVGKNARPRLFSLWSNLSRTGKAPLYEETFRGFLAGHNAGTNVEERGFFDSPKGNYLEFNGNPTPPTIGEHVVTLQGALGLTPPEMLAIIGTGEPGDTLQNHLLNIDTVSALYRHRLLARALLLSIEDLLALRTLSGINPFAPAGGDPIGDLDSDPPYQTTRFVDVAEAVSASGFKIADLRYLLQHRFDPVGRFRGDPAALLAFVKGLRAACEDAVVLNVAGYFTFEALYAELESYDVSAPTALAKYKEMWRGTLENTAVDTNLTEDDRLDPDDYKDVDNITDLIFDSGTQTLYYAGVLTQEGLDAIAQAHFADKDVLIPLLSDIRDAASDALAENPDIAAVTDLDDSFRPLMGTSEEKQIEIVKAWCRALNRIHPGLITPQVAALLSNPATSFTDERLRKTLLALYRAEDVDVFLDFWTTGVYKGSLAQDDFFKYRLDALLSPSQVDTVFGSLPAISEQRQREIVNRRCFVLSQLATKAVPMLVQEAVVTALAAETGTDATLARAALSHVYSPPQSPPQGDLVLLAKSFEDVAVGRGLTVAFTAGASPDEDLANQPAAVIDSRVRPKAAEDADQVRYEGYLEVATTKDYVFRKAGTADVSLRFDSLPEEPWASNAATVRLEAGRAYAVSCVIDSVLENDSRKWATLSSPQWDAFTFYPAESIPDAASARTVVHKVAQLAKGLSLSAREIDFFLSHPSDFGGFQLAHFPTDQYPGAPTDPFAPFLRVAGYARLKKELAGGTDDLIDVLADAARETFATPTEAESYRKAAMDRLGRVSRRTPDEVERCLDALGILHEVSGSTLTIDLHNDVNLARFWNALQASSRTGVPADKLAGWTTESVGFELAGKVRDAFRATHSVASWRRTAKPIFDDLRKRKRDALCAHLLNAGCTVNGQPVETIDQLFEFFLLDPGMEPVVLTSRLRAGISSVQTFIQRVFLNLEQNPDDPASGVDPAALDASQWAWMKRYRVWEANRKVLLFPENWLEPEFRDDKSHLYQALEGALLQDDVTNEVAEDAFFQYLTGLGSIARLHLAAIWCEGQDDPDANVYHLVGRTLATPRKYYYRKRANRIWTPWQPIDLDIPGATATPAMFPPPYDEQVAIAKWKERLWLFWITYQEFRGTGGDKHKYLKARLNWSEQVRGVWTPVRVSEPLDLYPYHVEEELTPPGDGTAGTASVAGTVYPDIRTFPLYIDIKRQDGEDGAIHVLFSGTKFNLSDNKLPVSHGSGTPSYRPAYALVPTKDYALGVNLDGPHGAPETLWDDYLKRVGAYHVQGHGNKAHRIGVDLIYGFPFPRFSIQWPVIRSRDAIAWFKESNLRRACGSVRKPSFYVGWLVEPHLLNHGGNAFVMEPRPIYWDPNVCHPFSKGLPPPPPIRSFAEPPPPALLAGGPESAVTISAKALYRPIGESADGTVADWLTQSDVVVEFGGSRIGRGGNVMGGSGEGRSAGAMGVRRASDYGSGESTDH